VNFSWRKRAINTAILSLLIASAAMADDDWGPFTGPWKRYAENPILEDSWGPGAVVRRQGKFWAFPTHPQVKTMLAVSDNGYDWRLAREAPILRARERWEGKYAGAKAALVTEDKVIIYYVGKQGIHERMGVATTTDPDLAKATWKKHPANPVFGPEDVSTDVERVFPDCTVKDDGRYYMFFDAGFDYNHPKHPRQYTINIASSDDGIHFKELATDIVKPGPEGSWESQAVSQAAVRKIGDWWYMIYSGFPKGASKRAQAFGLARALRPEGPWEKYPGNPIFAATGNKRDWDGAFVQHACPERIDGKWVLYYTGNDGNENVPPGKRYRQGLAIRKEAESSSTGMKLWKKVPLGELTGGFVLPTDLTGNGKPDLLLSYAQEYSAHLRLVAMNLDGEILWSDGDDSITRKRGSNPLRPLLTAFDFNRDGKTDVVAEFWNDGAPRLVMLAGATGEVLREVASPFDMSVRRPKGYEPSRPAPQALVARLDGPDKPASAILKYEASGTLPPVAVAYDHRLNERWEVRGRPWSEEDRRGADMGHQALVADLTGDGRDDVVLGQLAVDCEGKTIFRRDLEAHADGADVFTLEGKKRLLLTLCKTGPAYCLDATGKTIWRKTQKEVPHGQAGWVGDFLPDHFGLEAVMLVSGHYGIFHTFAADDGRKLAEFQHHRGIRHENGSRKYPDMPVKVRWRKREDSLWIPVDRMIVNGRGDIVARLGKHDAQVVHDLRPGAKKKQVAVQAVPVDLCGDVRDEVLLYQPYGGKAVYIFTQPDSNGAPKPYRPQKNAYNRRPYL